MIPFAKQEKIQNNILLLYRKLLQVIFPLDLPSLINTFDNCRYMTYQEFGKLNSCNTEDVIKLCKSRFGCTYYDVRSNRYLILCNTSDENSESRQRWTCGHELGHVICRHVQSSYQNVAYAETEADYFAATLLAPLPLFPLLNVKSPIDIQNIFGISAEAALYRFKEYLKFCKRPPTNTEIELILFYQSCQNRCLYQ